MDDEDVPLPDGPPPDDDPLGDLRVLIDDRFDTVDRELKQLRGHHSRAVGIDFLWIWMLVISVLIVAGLVRKKSR